MSKTRTVIANIKLFSKRHPWYQRVLIALFIILAGLGLLFAAAGSRLPSEVWFPDSGQYKSDDKAVSSLPVKRETAITKYGRAIRFTTTADWSTENTGTKPWRTTYEFRASKLLNASTCPNITNSESLLPSGCDKAGEFEGSPVYAINRVLPSGATEYFTTVNGVFIYIKVAGDGGQSLDYLKTFKVMSQDEATASLAANSKRVKQILAKQRTQKAATEHNGSLAYTRLDFAPALAGVIPEGWELSNGSVKSIEVDGTDADHPKMINTNYTNKNNRNQGVRWHVGKLSDFKLGMSCGPSPGYSMEYLSCHKVSGTGYYEASLYDDLNDFVRYLYYPVGDSLVITSTVVYSNNNERAAWPTELAKVQDTLTLNAKVIDKNELKGSKFYKMYY